VKVEKSGLVAVLLEVGEENAAVLLARSELADEIDTAHDLDALLMFGLEREQVEEVARLAISAIEPDDVNTRRRRDEREDHLASVGRSHRSAEVVACPRHVARVDRPVTMRKARLKEFTPAKERGGRVPPRWIPSHRKVRHDPITALRSHRRIRCCRHRSGGMRSAREEGRR